MKTLLHIHHLHISSFWEKKKLLSYKTKVDDYKFSKVTFFKFHNTGWLIFQFVLIHINNKMNVATQKY